MVTAVGDSRVYDGTTSSSGTPTFGPLFGTDSASFTQAFQSKDVLGPNGSTLLASGSVADGNGGRDYTISFVSAKGTITPAALTVTAVGDSRVYNGTTSSRAPRPSARCSAPTARASRRPSSRRMCSARTAARCWPRAVSPTATGARITPSASSAKGTITPAALMVTAVGDRQAYDGTTSSSGTPTFGPLFGTDSASFTQAFQSKDVLGPNGQHAVGLGQCRRRQRGPGLHHQLRLGQGHHHAGRADGDGGRDSRVDNGTTSSSGTPTFGPLFGTDSASFTQAFQSKDVLGPNGSTLLASGSVADGNGGRDYTISFVSAKGTITPAALMVTAVGDSRVYDGTTSSRKPRPSARCSAPTARASRRPSSRRTCSARTAARCWPRAVSPTATGAGITPSASSRPRAPSRRPR